MASLTFTSSPSVGMTALLLTAHHEIGPQISVGWCSAQSLCDLSAPCGLFGQRSSLRYTPLPGTTPSPFSGLQLRGVSYNGGRFG